MATMRTILLELCQGDEDVILENNGGLQYRPEDLLINDMQWDPAEHEEYMEREMYWIEDAILRMGEDGYIDRSGYEWAIKPASEAYD